MLLCQAIRLPQNIKNLHADTIHASAQKFLLFSYLAVGSFSNSGRTLRNTSISLGENTPQIPAVRTAEWHRLPVHRGNPYRQNAHGDDGRSHS